jgi:hypothetical protein
MQVSRGIVNSRKEIRMTILRGLRSSLLILLSLATLTLPAVPVSAGPPSAQGVHITPIGNPTWKPVDFHLFSAPVGTPETGFAEFLATALALLPPPNHQFHPVLGVGPGAPHDPPYDSELATGVAAQGFHEGVRFHTAEFSNGMGVFLAWMNVPAPGTTGSSPDFASGPIIPNRLFPIHVSSTDQHNGRKFSDVAEFDVPPLDQSLDPSFNVDGHSHFPTFLADVADFGPVGAKLPGSYEYRTVMLDQSGNGWFIRAHFAVGP